MEVITLNVGQGHLAVVRHAGHAIIVDAHVPANHPDYEFVAEALSQVLSGSDGSFYVDGLILTGLDKDHAHAKGVARVLYTYHPDWVMYPKYYKDTENATETFQTVDRYRTARKPSLERIPIRLDVLSSRQFYNNTFALEMFSPHKDDLDSSNNGSIVARVTKRDNSYGSFLITGDTELGRWEMIHRLFSRSLNSTILQAAHHGSDNGAHLKSVYAIQPHTVHISAGDNRQYNHPHAGAVAIYQNATPNVFCTQSGTIHTTIGSDWFGRPTVSTRFTQFSRNRR
mgnify:CR=1 FL=1